MKIANRHYRHGVKPHAMIQIFIQLLSTSPRVTMLLIDFLLSLIGVLPRLYKMMFHTVGLMICHRRVVMRKSRFFPAR